VVAGGSCEIKSSDTDATICTPENCGAYAKVMMFKIADVYNIEIGAASIKSDGGMTKLTSEGLMITAWGGSHSRNVPYVPYCYST
jgi:hypothetical protein